MLHICWFNNRNTIGSIIGTFLQISETSYQTRIIYLFYIQLKSDDCSHSYFSFLKYNRFFFLTTILELPVYIQCSLEVSV